MPRLSHQCDQFRSSFVFPRFTSSVASPDLLATRHHLSQFFQFGRHTNHRAQQPVGCQYGAQGGAINLFIAGMNENSLRKTLGGVGEQTLVGSGNYGKPEEFITATLVVDGDDVASDEVKYIVTQPDSFFSHLQDRQEIRAGLAASGAYSEYDDADLRVAKSTSAVAPSRSRSRSWNR